MPIVSIQDPTRMRRCHWPLPRTSSRAATHARFFSTVAFFSSCHAVPDLSASRRIALCLGHRAKLAERDMSRKVIEATRTGNDRLIGREPPVRPDPFSHLFAGLDIRRLNINGSDAELFVAETNFS